MAYNPIWPPNINSFSMYHLRPLEEIFCCRTPAGTPYLRHSREEQETRQEARQEMRQEARQETRQEARTNSNSDLRVPLGGQENRTLVTLENSQVGRLSLTSKYVQVRHVRLMLSYRTPSTSQGVTVEKAILRG